MKYLTHNDYDDAVLIINNCANNQIQYSLSAYLMMLLRYFEGVDGELLDFLILSRIFIRGWQLVFLIFILISIKERALRFRVLRLIILKKFIEFFRDLLYLY